MPLYMYFFNHEDENADNMMRCDAAPVTNEGDTDDQLGDTMSTEFTACRQVVDGNSNDLSESLCDEMIDEQDLDSGKISVVLFGYKS